MRSLGVATGSPVDPCRRAWRNKFTIDPKSSFKHTVVTYCLRNCSGCPMQSRFFTAFLFLNTRDSRLDVPGSTCGHNNPQART